MNTPHRHARRQPGKPHAIALACSALLMPAGALAQSAAAPAAAASAATDAQTVVVTGIRRGIETSVAIKRTSDSIVEAVSSEDLGKLPDISIAESLARLPGLTAQRVEGRAQNISIRGLAPQFAVTLLNSREIVSTGDNRSVEFDQFPAELINGATVYKSPDASLFAQGVAGTINLLTLRPLDMQGRQVNLNARGESNSNGSLVPGTGRRGNRLSASYVDQFADRTIGLALGYAHLDSPSQKKYFNAWWWGNTAVWGGDFPGLDGKTSSLQGFDTGVTSTDTKRDGVMAVLQWKPNKDFSSQLDLYYSKFDQTANGRELQANLGPPSWDGAGIGPTYTNPRTVVIGGDQVLVGGAASNVDPTVVMRYNKRKDNVRAIGWNSELSLGEWKTAADLSYSRAERNEIVAELSASAPAITGFSNFALDTDLSGFSQIKPLVNYGDSSVVQLRGLGNYGSLNGVAQAGSLAPIALDDELKGLRLTAKRGLDWGIFSGFEGGVNHTERDKSTVRTQTVFALKNGVDCVREGDSCAPIPGNILQRPVNLGFVGVGNLVSFNVPDAIATGVFDSGPTNQSSAPGRIWGVHEKIDTAMAKLGLDFAAGIPVHGNLGLQIVRSNQRSTGVAWDSDAGVAVPMSFSKRYTDVLPSLNLTGELTPTTLLRLGVAKVLARPNMEQMRAGFTASVATSGQEVGRWSGSGGNPNLEPWRARSYDLSLEKYYGKRSYVSAAYFYKDLKSTVFEDTITDFDFTGFPNTSGVTPVSNLGKLTAPINGQGGHVNGVEVAAALEGGLLMPALDGFGIIASFSDTSSNVPGTANNGQKDLKRPLEGLSGTVTSLVGYYEKHGFQFRVAQRYRSKFVAEVRSVFIDKSLASIGAERITDLQFGYNWESGTLKGLSVLFQVNNLTNRAARTSLADDSSTSDPLRMMPERFSTFGRQFLFGVNYKL